VVGEKIKNDRSGRSVQNALRHEKISAKAEASKKWGLRRGLEELKGRIVGENNFLINWNFQKGGKFCSTKRTDASRFGRRRRGGGNPKVDIIGGTNCLVGGR